MIVILQKDLKGTGKAGDVVKVSDGYARNMLIPRGIAKEATEGNIKNLKKQQEIAAEKRAEQKAAAEANAKRIGDLAIEIKTKGGLHPYCQDKDRPLLPIFIGYCTDLIPPPPLIEFSLVLGSLP